jgi:hypothetical protein
MNIIKLDLIFFHNYADSLKGGVMLLNLSYFIIGFISGYRLVL